MTTVNVTVSSARVRAALAAVPRIAAAGRLGPAKALLIRVGLAALFRIKEAFVIKARGGTDATGLKWAPLSPHTIAYHRRHPLKQGSKRRLPKQSTRAGYAPSYALTRKQRERWWQIYYARLGTSRDKSRAARAAWAIIKEEGATTLMERYGRTEVEILRDTGLLLTSLTPGTFTPGMTTPPKADKQIFRLGQGDVTIGTNREWAWTHHNGTARIPKRPLWPEPETWPQQWWDEISQAAADGIMDIVLYLLSQF